jgi:hypothetical protein
MIGYTQELLTGQQDLWDAQHAMRGAVGGLEGDHLVDVPNDAAVMFGELIGADSVIAEVGSANGRDARYWALQGHQVHCLDFSQVALGQLAQHAERQGVSDRIKPVYFDANNGRLPEEVDGALNGFYARSALHVGDKTLFSLLSGVNDRLEPESIILIEGKGPDDEKIARSVDIGDGLVSDPLENGHVRRVWTPESFGAICGTFGWTALSQEVVGEEWAGTDATFLRLVAVK